MANRRGTPAGPAGGPLITHIFLSPRAAAMKALTKVVLPIAIVIGMIGGVTFISQYSGSRPKNDKKLGSNLGDALVKRELLIFPVKQGNWDGIWDIDREPDSKQGYVAEFEVQTRSHYDFWFFNSNPDPVDVKLTSTSCTCAGVTIGQASSADYLVGQFVMGVQPPANGVEHRSGVDRLAPLATNLGLWPLIDRWEPLAEKGEPVRIRGSQGPMRPGIGIVRLGWEAKSSEPVNLRVKLWASQGDRGEDVELTLPVCFVKPVRLDVLDLFRSQQREPLQVRELNAKGQKETVEFRCWSSTRDSFELKVAEDRPNPCIKCDWQPMTEEERDDLAKKMNHQTRVRSGYRVTVTVHERISDKELLDLGPFHRRLIVTGPDTRESVILSGSVKGEVRLRSTDKDVIDLGSFRAAQGKSKTMTLTSEQPDLRLRLDSWSPDYLEAVLDPPKTVDGVKRWELTVTVPAGRAGRLPADSAVILQTQGESGRRMRIPVTGEATQ